MLTSGGKILAIGSVKTDENTISGNGVTLPIGVNENGLKSYSVEPGNSNVTIEKIVNGKEVIYKVAAVGGGSTGGSYEPVEDSYVTVDNVNNLIGLEQAFINSAASGYDAMKAINEQSAAWSKDTTYTAGPNIDITVSQVISGKDWTPELNTKVNQEIFNTWSGSIAENSADWDSVYVTVETNSADWNNTYNDFSINSANWNNTYNNVSNNSSNWNSVYGTVETESASWNEVTAKLDTSEFTDWSVEVENSAANLSAAIENLPTPKYYDDVRASVADNSATWNEVSTKLDTSEFTDFTDGFRTWSADVENSAASISAYIRENEEYWNNSISHFNVQSTTPDLLTVASSYDSSTKTTTFEVSAKEQTNFTNYSAGKWIDSEKLSDGTVEVSGQKTFKTKSPLYFSADASDPNIVWLLHDVDEKYNKTDKAILIANGWNGSDYYDNNAGLSASIPANDINGEYIFHFSRQMGVQININAKFIAHSSATDMIGEVGFGAVTLSGQQLTNQITYNMFGALEEQYYAASTIARIAADNFPEEGVDLSFKFVGDSDFLKNIQYPCISVHEIITEA